MTSIKSLFGRTLPVAVALAPRVASELAVVEEQLQTLEAKRGDLALAQAMGEDGADAEMVGYRADVEALRHRVSDLRAAHVVALGQDAQVEARKKAAAHAGQIASVRQRLLARTSAAVKLQVALTRSAEALAELAAANENVLAAIPAGSAIALGDAALYPKQLHVAVAEELFRVGAGKRSSSGSFPSPFPGAQAPSLSADPAAMTSLSDKFKADAAYVMQVLEGTVARAAPVVLAPVAETLPTVEGVEEETADARPAEFHAEDMGGPVAFVPQKVALL